MIIFILVAIPYLMYLHAGSVKPEIFANTDCSAQFVKINSGEN